MHPRTPLAQDSLSGTRAYVDQDDVDAVAAALLSGCLSHGPALARFEAALAALTGAAHAVALSSGAAAAHIALTALGVGPARRVWAAANSEPERAEAVLLCGGALDFLDIDPRTGNLDVRILEERLALEPAPHAVIATHAAGLPCDMEWLIALRRRHDFLLVEDAAEALGGRYRVEGRWFRVGEHPEVAATLLAFEAGRHITTGEGGAVLTHDAALAERVRRLGAGCADGAPRGLAFPYALSELHAALGASQLKKLPDFQGARAEIALRYLAELRGFTLPHPGGLGANAEREHAWGRFVIRCARGERDELVSALRRAGVQAEPERPPAPLEPRFCGRAGDEACPEASGFARTALCLPLSPALSEAEQARVIATLHEWKREGAAA